MRNVLHSALRLQLKAKEAAVVARECAPTIKIGQGIEEFYMRKRAPEVVGRSMCIHLNVSAFCYAKKSTARANACRFSVERITLQRKEISGHSNHNNRTENYFRLICARFDLMKNHRMIEESISHCN